MIIGITGNTGTGKSLIADFFGEWGGFVISADSIGWTVLQNRDIIRKIKEVFGNEIIRDEEVDRKRLGDIVFKDIEKLQQLNEIVHPVLLKMLKEAIGKIDKDIVIVDAALIYEWAIKDWFDYTILAVSRPHFIKSRLKRLGISGETINGKLKSQMNPEEAKKYADFIIENNGSIKELRKESRKVWERIVGEMNKAESALSSF